MQEPHSKKQREEVGLPIRVFLYTMDQVSYITSMQEVHIRNKYVHYDGRSVGPRPMDKMLARNISPHGETPEWRVAEEELVRWLRHHGYRVRVARERKWISQ